MYSCVKGWVVSLLIILQLIAGSANPVWGAEDFRSSINDLLDQPVRPISEVIPGYTRPPVEPPSLIVANLRYKGTDKLRWGKAFGGILRWNTNYCPQGLLRVPDTLPSNLYYDLGTQSLPRKEVLESTRSLRVAYERLGVENGICGGIEINDASFSLQFDMLDLATMRRKHSFGFKGPLDDLPGALSSTSLEIFKALGVELSDESQTYLAKPPAKNFAQLRQYVAALTASSTPDVHNTFGADIRTLLGEGLNLPASLLPYLLSERCGNSLTLDRYREIEKQYTTLWPLDSGVRFYLARYRVVPEASQLLYSQIEAYKKLVAENPHDPMMMIILGGALFDAEDYTAALPVYLEVAERFPHLYRAWWGLAACLENLAWQIRGHDYWDQIPMARQRTFGGLIPVIYRVLDRGLELNPECAYLWQIRMRICGADDGCSSEFFTAFEKAAEYGPDWKSVYEDAYNYTRIMWGGTPDDRERIVTTAAKLNPNAIWPQELHLINGRISLNDLEKKDFRSQGSWLGVVARLTGLATLLDGKDIRTPDGWLAYSKRLAGYAKLVCGEKRTGQIDWLCLDIFNRSGAKQEGCALIRTMLRELENDELLSLNLYLLATYSLEFDDPALVKECLARYREDPYLKGTNRKVACLLAEADILAGSREKGEEQFKTLLKEHSLDFLTRNAILDLSTRTNFDPALVEECQSLIASATTGQVDIVADVYSTLSSKGEEQAHADILVFLRHMALAHQTAREGDTGKAVSLYNDAMDLKRKNDARYLDPRDPIVHGPLYRQIRKANGEA